MRSEHLRHIDLNLLRTLAALLEERHVTRAAERCSLSQPAMSRALERLREAFGDELLVRYGRGYERTARGQRLLTELENLLPQLESLWRPENFDPAACEERFHLAMTDHASMVLLPGLVQRVAAAAPRARLDCVPWHDRRFDDLESGRLDLVLDVAGAPATLATETLFSDDFVCVVAADHPLRARRPTLQRYLQYPHVIVNVLSGQQTPVDQPLGALGRRRRVGLTVPYFAPAVLAVAKTDMILTLPRRMARKLVRAEALRTMLAPLEVKGFKYAMTWHPRLSSDRTHEWFRDQVRAVAKRV